MTCVAPASSDLLFPCFVAVLAVLHQALPTRYHHGHGVFPVVAHLVRGFSLWPSHSWPCSIHGQFSSRPHCLAPAQLPSHLSKNVDPTGTPFSFGGSSARRLPVAELLLCAVESRIRLGALVLTARKHFPWLGWAYSPYWVLQPWTRWVSGS